MDTQQHSDSKMDHHKSDRRLYWSCFARGPSASRIAGWVAVLFFISRSTIWAMPNECRDSRRCSSLRYYLSGSSVLAGPEIGQERDRLQEMQAEVERLNSQLDATLSRINNLKQTIKIYEAQKARGRHVDPYEYRRTVTEHSELLDKYERLRSDYRNRYSEYEKELKRVNEMIDQHNRRRQLLVWSSLLVLVVVGSVIVFRKITSKAG
jgi:hypothetical protein